MRLQPQPQHSPEFAAAALLCVADRVVPRGWWRSDPVGDAILVGRKGVHVQVTIRDNPAYAIAYCELDHGEVLQCESGAMAAMSHGLKVSAGLGKGGMFGAAKRKWFGGESFFLAKYTAQVHSAWVAVAPKFPGDVGHIVLEPGDGYIMEQGAFLAASGTIDLDVKWGGLHNIALREGATILHLDGVGDLMFSSYGGLEQFKLADGEQMIVDSGHFVCATDTVELAVGPLGSLASSALSGEFLVAQMTGPGNVWIQTRAEQSLKNWIFPERKQNR